MENINFSDRVNSHDFKVAQGLHLIEASAGTGKTYCIQDVYARLVMETDFRVANILVMTFTEAATKELQERLRTILLDLQKRFLNQDCESKENRTEKEIKEIDKRNARADKLIDCVADKQMAQKQVELALLEFDGAAISTIHGFCQRVLQRYAFETGMNFSQKIGKDGKADLKARIEDWWRTNQDKEVSLNDVNTYARELSGKADYVLDGDDKALQVADGIVKAYEAARFERETLTFDDLLRGLRDALRDESNGKALAGLLKQEFRAALIDEFQDTDPVQYEIFRRIFIDCEQPGPLYFVGDPKQAIYAFRGGDIFTYFNAKKTEGLQNHRLNINHRSTSRLVDGVNVLFEDTAPDGTFGEDIPYVASKVDKEPEIKGEPLERPLQIIEFATETKPAKGAFMPHIMDRMADEILDILAKTDKEGKRIFSPKDIAILMGAKTDMPTLQQKLLDKGIPNVIQDSGNVFNTSIAHELRTFLLAVSKAENARRDEIRAALLTVFGGVNFDEASSLDDQAVFAQKVEALKTLKNAWRAKGFPALVCHLEENGYLLRLARKPDGRRQLSDIGQILELCCAATKEVGSAPEALVDWLTERIGGATSGEETDAEEYARELETDGEAVRIMTIHSSKGLQFPIVFLPDCWRVNSPYDPRNQFPLPNYHNEQNQLVFASGKDALTRAKAESTREKTRLLYVALTRAKQQTVLFAPSQWPDNEPLEQLLAKLPKDGAGADPPYQWIAWEQPLTYQNAGAPYAAPQEGEAVAAEAPRTDWNLSSVRGSYSSLAPGHGKIQADDDSRDNDDVPFVESNRGKNPPEDILDLPAGPRLGNCWHDILEKLPFDADTETIRRMTEAELQANGFDTDETTLRLTVKMLEDTLNHPLKSRNGTEFSLRDIDWNDRLSEQEFDFSSVQAEKTTAALKIVLQKHWGADPAKQEFIRAMEKWDRPIPRGYLKGFMDLVFRHDGIYYVVDWKSNTLDRDIANFTEEGIREEMAKNGYFFQYMLYAAVLHCYLKQRLGERYSHGQHFGGVRYYFLRGMGKGAAPVFADIPEEELLDDFAKALGMEVK